MFLANRSEKYNTWFLLITSISTSLLLRDTSNTHSSKTIQSHHIHVHEVAKYLQNCHTELSCSNDFKDGHMTKRTNVETTSHGLLNWIAYQMYKQIVRETNRRYQVSWQLSHDMGMKKKDKRPGATTATKFSFPLHIELPLLPMNVYVHELLSRLRQPECMYSTLHAKFHTNTVQVIF